MSDQDEKEHSLTQAQAEVISDQLDAIADVLKEAWTRADNMADSLPLDIASDVHDTLEGIGDTISDILYRKPEGE